MATYKELYDLRTNSDLQDKVATAVAVAADTIQNEDGATLNHANRIIWAGEAMSDPGSKRDGMLAAVLAANKASDPSQITGASDSAIQANVDAAVDLFAQG